MSYSVRGKTHHLAFQTTFSMEKKMNKKLFFTTLLMVLALMLSACAPTQTTDTGVTIDSEVDPNVYKVRLVLEEEDGYTEGHASLSGSTFSGYGSVSGRYWEDGKGILRGTLESVEPTVDFASKGDTIVIKTTDRKVMGLIPGDAIDFACIADFEPVCAINETNSTTVGMCVDIWEFDYCRIVDITPAPTQAGQ